jgi:hypothetical protein
LSDSDSVEFSTDPDLDTRVRVKRKQKRKKMACPARVAEAGQENIETMHEPKPIQATDIPCMDKVAVLWGIPMTHKPR